jgi:hypothetical protein
MAIWRIKFGFRWTSLVFVVMDKAAKKFTGWEMKPAFEEGGEDNYLIGVGRTNVFILSRPPLKDSTRR